jgi:hypothetical protein
MATNIDLNLKNGNGQKTYTTTITGLGSDTQFPLPTCTIAWSCAYKLAGSGSLQIQQSCNDPLEVLGQQSGSGIVQLWKDVGTASTAGTVQFISGTGAPTMLRGVVTSGTGTDALTIVINASYTSA